MDLDLKPRSLVLDDQLIYTVYRESKEGEKVFLRSIECVNVMIGLGASETVLYHSRFSEEFQMAEFAE